MDDPKRRRARPLTGANLEDEGQNLRLRLGAVMLAVGLGLAVLLVRADVARIWRLSLFVPFFFATFGAWQGLYRTCPGLVREGCRQTCEGRAKIADPQQLGAARRLARRVTTGAFTAAALATALVTLLP